MTTRFRNSRDLADAVANNSELQEKVRTNPAAALRELVADPLHTDRWIYRIVVFALALVVLVALIGTLVSSKDVSHAVALGSTALGALAGLLVPSPLNHES